MSNQPKDGSTPCVIAYDAEVSSLVVALVYAADIRGDPELGEGSLTRKFCKALSSKLIEARSDEELCNGLSSAMRVIIQSREDRNAPVMLTGLRQMQELVGVTVLK